MIWTIVILLCIAFLLIVLLCLPITIEVSFGKGILHYQGKVHVRWLFGIVRTERRFVDIHPTMTSEGPSLHAEIENSRKRKPTRQRRILTAKEVLHRLREARLWIRALKRGWPVLRQFCHHVHILEFDTRLTFGTGDAPSTGVLYGAMWAGLATVTGFMTGLCQLDAKPEIDVHPEFQSRTFDFYQSCIFRFAPGYAIAAGFRLYRVWKRTVGRRRHGTPDFRSHADRDEQYS